MFFGQIKCKQYPDSDVLVDNFHKAVDGSVDNAKAYIHGRNGCYLNLSLSGGNEIFTLKIVRKIERVSGVTTFKLQTVERIKSSDF